jgi:glycosyltransferase involved in cell wall biosynthesis
MRVAVLSWTAQRLGGVEAYLSLVLPAMRRAGLDVAFWYEHHEAGERQAIDMPDEIPVFSAAELGAAGAVEKLREWKPDVLYVHGLHDTNVELRLLRIAPAVQFVHTYIGTCVSGTKTHTRPGVIACDRRFGMSCLAYYFPRGCGGKSPATMWNLYREQSRRLELLRQYRAVLTHSTHMKTELDRHGVRCTVVPFPVTSVAGHDARRGGAAVSLLFVGRMDALKGGLFLLDSLPEVQRALNRPVRLTLAGDGPDRREWGERARHIRADHHDIEITFPGWQSAEQVDLLMATTDLLVVPSVWPEPFGSVGPAAAQHGVPAAAFAVGGIPEWLHEGVNGHLADAHPPSAISLAGAIVACMQDPQHYAALCDGARDVGSSFTMERHLPELMRVFRQASATRW